MTRISLLADDQLEPAAREIISGIKARGAKVPDLYRMLANAPELLAAWTDIAWPLRTANRTDRAFRELLIMRTSYLTQAQYEWAHHWKLAIEAGVPEAKLHALPDYATHTAFDVRERAALRFADALVTTGKVPDTTFDALSEHFDAAEMIHLTLTISFYVCVAHMASAFELDLEPAYRGVPSLPAIGIGP